MENDEITDETQVETPEGQTAEVETPAAEGANEPIAEGAEGTIVPEGEKLTYEQKLARATTPEEKFAIADAEANKNRRILNKRNNPAPAAAPKPKQPQPVSPQPSVEDAAVVAALRVNGMPEALVSELKVIAKVRGVDLISAQTDPIFVAVKDKFEKDRKRKDASLPASRGAGAQKPQKSVSSPNLSRDEHKEMVNRALSGN